MVSLFPPILDPSQAFSCLQKFSQSYAALPLQNPLNPFAAARKDPQPTFERYAEWIDWAHQHDEKSGLAAWKENERSDLYDHRIIRHRYDELVEARASQDPDKLIYYLNEGLHGNMGGMGNPALYGKARSGTKHLINDYINEIVAALDDFENLADDTISRPEKLAYFQRAAGCFGRSALMFSGAGSLGAFHIGVAKALAEQDLIPKVVSGASAGSMIAAIIGTHQPSSIAPLITQSESLAQHLSTPPESASSGASARGANFDQNQVMELIETIIPDMTFLEAFDETGIAINVSIAPSRLHQRSRLLNAITSPNAMIREAVLASCAVPGVFPPVTLAAKDETGRRQPYVPTRQWVDGSITDDLPARRLARLYSVNHFITSQTNPMVFWLLPNQMPENDLTARWMSIFQAGLRDWMRAVYPFVMDQVRGIYPLNMQVRMMFGLVTQAYTADINILPQNRSFDPTRLLAPLTEEETSALIKEGERATWPKIEMIRNCTKVSRRIDEALDRLQGAL